MMPVFTVCFFGHRRIEDFRVAEERTEALIRHLIMRSSANHKDAISAILAHAAKAAAQKAEETQSILAA